MKKKRLLRCFVVWLERHETGYRTRSRTVSEGRAVAGVLAAVLVRAIVRWWWCWLSGEPGRVDARYSTAIRPTRRYRIWTLADPIMYAATRS